MHQVLCNNIQDLEELCLPQSEHPMMLLQNYKTVLLFLTPHFLLRASWSADQCQPHLAGPGSSPPTSIKKLKIGALRPKAVPLANLCVSLYVLMDEYRFHEILEYNLYIVLIIYRVFQKISR